jgi:hypothetical protein
VNLYFVKDERENKIKWVGTAIDRQNFLDVFNHFLYNLNMVTDYFQRAELFDQGNGQFYVVVTDGYHDDPDKKYESGRYLLLERQYSPNRIYDHI